MSDELKSKLLTELVGQLELPPSYYEKAKDRYESIGGWLGRPSSSLSNNDPHIFAQGSFSLGTAIYPLDRDDGYDLDLGCKLRVGIEKYNTTQEQLKAKIGEELETYRQAKNITEVLDEKKRCWTLHYKDELSFHMDVVPCIPANKERIQKIFESLRSDNVDENIAQSSSATTISITDNTLPNYTQIDDNWEISNPEGYCLWFQRQLKKGLRKDGVFKTAMEAQVDDIPTYPHKTILQRVIQLLKRHRDVQYIDNGSSKPISVIITTLSARAYNGEQDIAEAITNVLEKMPSLIRPTTPRIPNPTDPEEDFADKWSTSEGQRLRLEDNFHNWIASAKRDFNLLFKFSEPSDMERFLKERFYESVNEKTINDILLHIAPINTVSPKTISIKENSPKPWMNIDECCSSKKY